MSQTEPIRNPHDVAKLLNYFKNHPRNYVLATIGVYTALRISDILNLSCNDVYDFNKGTVRNKITLVEQKSKKSKIIHLNKTVVSALKAYFPQVTPGAPLICNFKTGKAISRIQAYRIIREAASTVGISYNVSCHSLRKTFGYHSWKRGISPVVIMHIYNHSSMAVTQRYLGVAQDDLDVVYAKLEFQLVPNMK